MDEKTQTKLDFFGPTYAIVDMAKGRIEKYRVVSLRSTWSNVRRYVNFHKVTGEHIFEEYSPNRC